MRQARDLSACKSFHVARTDSDKLGLAELIVAEMSAQGFACRSDGKAGTTDSLIRYRWETLPGRADRLGRLVLEVHQPGGDLLASSRSEQPASLMPADNAEMTRLAVRNLLAATPGPNGHPRGSLMERETLLW